MKGGKYMKKNISFKSFSMILKMLMIFILCVMASALLISMVSCSKNTGTETDDNSGSGENAGSIDDNAQEDEPDISETEASRILSEAPERNFEGYNFRILSRQAVSDNHHWEAKDIVADEETGDVINDAVYRRNTAVTEKYNIKITRTDSEDAAGIASRTVLAGSDEYDAMFTGIASTVGVAQNGILLNLKSIPYVDLPKHWYDQNANAQLSVGGKLYATFCDFTIMDKDATWVYLFNKQLIKDLGLDDPYKLVKDGKWTIEKMAEMSRGAAKDLDGDGVMTWQDQFGWQGECWNMYAGIIASGIQTVSKNDDDLPEYTGLGERGIIAFNQLLSLLGDKNLCLRSDDISYSGNLWTDVMDASFMEGRILFVNAGMNRVTLFRSMDTDFGIIPSPKLDENQPDYCDTISPGQATALSVPASVSDLERTGIIIDSLCAESAYTLIPAYYDITLKTKFARDDESAEMLDIIFGTRSFDLALVYGWGDLVTLFATAMRTNNENIISNLEKVEPRIRTAIEKTVTAYDSNES